MTDDIRSLLDHAVPARVSDLDMERAVNEGTRRTRRKTAATAASSLALVGVVAAIGMNWPLGRGVAVDPSPAGGDVAAQLKQAGCTPVALDDPADSNHFDPETAPPAEAIYDLPLPSAGPHLSAISPTPDHMPDAALDVRAVVHNLEHGAVAIWIDTDQVDDATVDAIEEWATSLHGDGFTSKAGGSILMSPAPPGAEVAPVSFRAWKQALDCKNWIQVIADDFVAQHYGTRGQAPEKGLSPYPTPDPLAAATSK